MMRQRPGHRIHDDPRGFVLRHVLSDISKYIAEEFSGSHVLVANKRARLAVDSGPAGDCRMLVALI
jgi:hypothetical protein